MNTISGFSLTDQAFILTEIVDRLERERYDCWMTEYGFADHPAQIAAWWDDHKQDKDKHNNK